jgi:hypothetical protein
MVGACKILCAVPINEEGIETMKHIAVITQTPAKADIPFSAIIEAISAVLAVLAGVLGTKEGVS